jgi:hypothetical protein
MSFASETLLDIIGVDFADYGSLELTEARSEGTSLTLSFHVSADDYPGMHPNWNVICRGVKEHSLSLGFHYDCQLSADHVLLMPHRALQTSTSFYGKAENPSAVVGALVKCHRTIAGDWIPFNRFLNKEIDLTELIAGGFGMLAEGPEPFIQAYEDSLRAHGFSTSHVKPSEPVGKEMSVLILDQAYVIAEEFIPHRSDVTTMPNNPSEGVESRSFCFRRGESK